MKNKRTVLLLTVLQIVFSSYIYAEKVRAVLEDGQLELEDGRKVILAGILSPPSPEGIRMLPLLLAGREVKLEFDSKLQKAAGESAPLPVYLYVTTTEISLPYSFGDQPRDQKVMVNELMLATGAARVDENLNFKWKDRFVQTEESARQKGEGIWSYSSP